MPFSSSSGNATKKYLVYALIIASVVFLASQYIARSYGLPQWITIQIKSEKRIFFDVYYDIGEGYGENYKTGVWVTGTGDFQAVTLRLPMKHLKSFRIDPLTEPGIVYIKSIKVSGLFGVQRLWSAKDILNDFSPQHDIGRFELVNDSLLIHSTGNDPWFLSAVSVLPVYEPSAVVLTAAVCFFLLGGFSIYRIARQFDYRKLLHVLCLDVKERYLAAFIIVFVLVLNYPKLHLYFLSDDFTLLHRYQSIKAVFQGSVSYHINPVPQFFVFYLGYWFAGLNPFYYHALTLLLHSINVLLVFKLTHTLLHNKWTSMTAGLLFAVYFMNYEVVYWITGVFYLLLTLFYVSALLLFMQYRKEKKKKYYILFVTAFALCVFTMEQGVTLLAACMLCDLFVMRDVRRFSFHTWKERGDFLIGELKKYIAPIIIVAFFFILKHSMAPQFIVNPQTFVSFVKTTIGMIWHLFIPYPYGVSNGIFYGTSQWNYRVYVILLGFVTTGYVLLKRYRDQRGLAGDADLSQRLDPGIYAFLLGCMVSYVIPHSIATIMQARYFYLPSVFSSIILGSLFTKTLTDMKRTRSRARIFFHLTIVVFIAASIPVNIKFLRNQLTQGATASQITRNIINDTKRYLSDEGEPKDLYFVNLPDGIYRQKEFGWPDAYVFRNGIFQALKLTYPSMRIERVRECRTETQEGVIVWHMHELLTTAQLHQLVQNNNNIVLMYDPRVQTIQRLMSRNGLLRSMQ